MMTVLQANIEIPEGTPAPDKYDLSSGRTPPHEFVVTRQRNGSTASVFNDLAWDFSAYTPDHKTKRVYFAFWGAGVPTPAQHVISEEIRLIAFCIIWRRHGAPLAVGTLVNYITVLCACAEYADARNGTLSAFFNSPDEVIDFVRTRCSGWMAETFGSLLKILSPLGEETLGFLLVGEKCMKKIKQHNKDYRSTIRQHAPMPTKIYSHFLASLRVELSEWILVADDMLELFKTCSSDPRIGRCSASQPQISKKLGLSGLLPTFEQLAPPACMDYMQAKGCPFTTRSLAKLIGHIQSITKLTAQAYSGMRDDEASSLPYDCMEKVVINAREHFFVLGRTTKLAHGLVKRTRWVTCQDAMDALKAAQAIADVVYSEHDVRPGDGPKQSKEYPLFVSLRYMPFARSAIRPVDGLFLTGYMQDRDLPDSCLLPITDDDIKELEQIDPFRAWRSELKFQIGAVWSFTTHQLRRSLALYAQRSGLVSLPSLKRQLKHLTEEMARYYARGSQFATNFIGDDIKHFGVEWRRTEPESAAISYILNVLLNDDQLFGGHANWVEHRQKTADGEILLDRALTQKRFQKGEMAYRETILGGCTSTSTCNNVAIRWLHVDCLRDNCKNLVCSVPKLERVVAAQTKLLSRLDQATVEYRTEEQDLLTLQMALIKGTQNNVKVKT